MSFLVIVILFVVGGIIYKMGKTNNDTSQVVDGATEGGCLLMALLHYSAPLIIIIGIIVLVIRSCS